MKNRAALAAVLLLTALARADEFEDLGALTPHTMILLEKNTERSDFAFFQVEARSLTPRPDGTEPEPVKFITTNTFLVASNFLTLPSGKVLMAVKSMMAGSTESGVSTYTFELWRGDPPRPTARKVVHILRMPARDSLDKAIERSRGRSDANPVMPPMPPGMTNPSAVPLRMPAKLEPLPGGRSMDYAQNLDEQATEAMRKYFNKPGRRSQ